MDWNNTGAEDTAPVDDGWGGGTATGNADADGFGGAAGGGTGDCFNCGQPG